MKKIDFEKVDYHMKATSIVDYTLSITMFAPKGKMDNLLSMAISKVHQLKKTTEHMREKVTDAIEEFDALPEHLPYLNRVMPKQLLKVENQLKEDSIRLVTKKVIACRYLKHPKDLNNPAYWEIIALIEGKYAYC